jgi:ABC-type branched-subunit amino acid transport system substrate-binding protein
VLAAVTALTVTACGSSNNSGGAASAASPGVTANSILLGATTPLTGPAAPGYSEISAASQAMFNYINANGGINGRKITLKYLDDAYNPTQTVTLTKQLVLQDKVFATVGSLGTPTQTKVQAFMNSEKVPQLFVASGCVCWNQPAKYPETFGYQTDYVKEGKILGQYIEQHFAGKKIAVFYQDDDFGQGGLQGISDEVQASQIVTKQAYQPGNTDISAQVQAIAAAKPDVLVSFSIPAYTALLRLGELKANISPTLVVSNVGIDPTTVEGLLASFAKQGGASLAQPAALIEGVISDAYLPPTTDTSNSWIALFKKVHDQYLAKLPFDGNVEVGMAYAYGFAQALVKAGKNPTRAGVIQALQSGISAGPGLVPLSYSSSSHAGFEGVQIAIIHNGAAQLQGTPLTTDDANGPIQPYKTPQAPAPANGIPTG